MNQPNDEVLNPLLIPFQAVYEDGELMKMTIESTDVLWSINIKRALAALFQLKLGLLDDNAFFSQEVSNVNFILLVYNVFFSLS